MNRRGDPDWQSVLAASGRLQRLLPDAVLVGGTAAASHAGHRVSFDDDHVIADLQERFDEVLEHLERSDGWTTARVNRPVLILGSLDGIETGIRQLIRRRPLEVEQLDVPGGSVRVPTLPEMLRVKAWLVLRRNAMRDYLDVVALADRLDGQGAVSTLHAIDEYYEDQLGPGSVRAATQLAKQLADPAPYDLSELDLRHYRKLDPRWQEWGAVVRDCRALAVGLLDAHSEA